MEKFDFYFSSLVHWSWTTHFVCFFFIKKIISVVLKEILHYPLFNEIFRSFSKKRWFFKICLMFKLFFNCWFLKNDYFISLNDLFRSSIVRFFWTSPFSAGNFFLFSKIELVLKTMPISPKRAMPDLQLFSKMFVEYRDMCV